MENIVAKKTELLPDYDVNSESLSFDYKLYTTMYPVSSLRADTLAYIGLNVYQVVKGVDSVKTYRAGKKHKFSSVNQYAVKKTDWQDFIVSKDGEYFIKLWEQTANYTRKIMCLEPVMQKDEMYRCYEDIYWEETAKCRDYLNAKNADDAVFILNDSFRYENIYGQTLAVEYANKLWIVKTSLQRKDANLLCGYMQIVKMQYDYILDEFYKTIQHKEGTK